MGNSPNTLWYVILAIYYIYNIYVKGNCTVAHCNMWCYRHVYSEATDRQLVWLKTPIARIKSCTVRHCMPIALVDNIALEHLDNNCTPNKGKFVHRLSAVVLLPSTREECSRAVSQRLEQTIVDAKDRSALHRKDARQQWWHSVYLQRQSCSASRRSFTFFTWDCR